MRERNINKDAEMTDTLVAQEFISFDPELPVKESNELSPDSSKAKIAKAISMTTEVPEGILLIKDQLVRLVEQLDETPSLISRLAQYWANMALWQKIGFGLLLVAPILVLGIVFHLYIPIIIAVITALVYIPGGILLENHNQKSLKITDQLAEYMCDLADILETVLDNLNFLQEQVAKEVDDFHQENERLAETLSGLKIEISHFEEQVIQLSSVAESLTSNNDKLKGISDAFKLQIEQLSLGIDNFEREYDHRQLQLTALQKNLGSKIDLLKETCESLKRKDEIAEQNTNDMKVLIGNLSSCIPSKQEKEDLIQTLSDFFFKKNDYLEQWAKKMKVIIEERKVLMQKMSEVLEECEDYSQKMGEVAFTIEEKKAIERIELGFQKLTNLELNPEAEEELLEEEKSFTI